MMRVLRVKATHHRGPAPRLSLPGTLPPLLNVLRQQLHRMLYCHICPILVEPSPDLHDAAWAVDEHKRCAGLLDVFQLALQDRRRISGSLSE